MAAQLSIGEDMLEEVWKCASFGQVLEYRNRIEGVWAKILGCRGEVLEERDTLQGTSDEDTTSILWQLSLVVMRT